MRLLLSALVTALAGIAAGAGVVLLLVAAIDEDDAPLPERWRAGVNLTAFLPDAYGEPEARRAILTARAVGTELVLLSPTWYMDDASSTEIQRDPEKTPTDESVVSVAAAAKAAGLELALKPHIDVRDGTFRGDISPADTEAWFDSYREMILGYADLAGEIDADVFVVGTELTSMSLDPEPWRELIDEIRDRYGGDLTFAATGSTGPSRSSSGTSST